MTKSLVTGAAGFIGSHVLDRLLELEHEVVGVDCFTDGYARGLKERNLVGAKGNQRFRFVEGDLLDIDLHDLLTGIDHVFHLAGQAGVRPSWGEHFAAYLRNNIAATQRLLETVKATAVATFVFSSSSSVYGNAKALPVTESALPQPVSPYGVTKLAAEHLCGLYRKNFAVPCVSLRYFTAYGPRQRPEMAIQRFLSAAATGAEVTVYGDGSQTRDFTFVDDVVAANVQALAAPDGDRIYNVCGGSRVSLNEVIDIVEDVTAKPLRRRYAPPAEGDAIHTLGDNSLAQKELGFIPRTQLAAGISAQWRWLLDAGRAY